MKKRIGLIVIISIIIIVVCLLIWRLWPHTLSDLLPFDMDSTTSFSVYANVRHFEGEQSYTDTFYRMDDIEPQNSILGKILEILDTSDYQQDYRNLLPWDVYEVMADKNYDGNTVRLLYVFGDEEDEYVAIDFISSSLIAVSVGEGSGYRFYHPTNHETIYNLVEYLKTNGTIG